jgi:glutathione peroxidase
MEKINHLFIQFLTDNEVTGKADIKWNFEKFLIDKDGNVVARYSSKVEPKVKN